MSIQVLYAQKFVLPSGDRTWLMSVLKYDSSSVRIVSGHRGGRLPGYPENSVEGLARVLEAGPAFF